MGKDYFGSHAAKDKGHGAAEKNEAVFSHERRVRRVEPCTDGEGIDDHGRPFEKDGR